MRGVAGHLVTQVQAKVREMGEGRAVDGALVDQALEPSVSLR